MRTKLARFSNQSNNEFIIELRHRVNDYFNQNNLEKFSNANMVFKTVFMVSLFFVPYVFVVSGIVSNYLVFILMWALMGMGSSGIGLSIMHDANHGSYSRYRIVNTILGHLLDMVGGSSRNWIIQHNKLHHTFTNVDGIDEDIKSRVVLRFSPNQKRYGFHRFQFIYAWFLYCLMTFFWVTTKDFMQLNRYKKNGLVRKDDYAKLMMELVIWKVVYFTYILVLPLIFAAVPAYLVIIGFATMHVISGLALSCIFQPAHVMPTSEYPVPDKDGNLENSWAIHQLLTTTNFAPKSRIFTWFVGGLNFQVEHHLFPNICHVHYKRISRIVEATAKEYNLPYHFQRTYVGALWNHGKMLYRLGKQDYAYANVKQSAVTVAEH